MKCPKCGSEMFEFPIMGDENVLSYYLCIDCVPYVRIIKHCVHRIPKNIGNISNQTTVLWCTKVDKQCNIESDAKTGYVYCPQIREWQEKQADWVKRLNMEFEEKQKLKESDNR